MPPGAARAPCPHARGSAKLATKTTPLRADWDRQPRLGDGRGYHVARTGVDKALGDFIERRAEGALLVVGHRGSGKTSSVVAAANRAAGRKGRGKAVIPIMITATSMDKTGGEDHKTLLRSLIWALHRKAEGTEGIDKKLRGRAKELYLDATASVKSYEMSQSEARSQALGLGVHLAPAVTASFAVPAFYGMIELGLAAAGAAALFSVGAKLAWDKKASKSSTRLYRRDYGFADMQHDFEGLLRDYSKKYSIVFILDEFDKDDDFADMIRPLKMLLNQGNAAYVVITSPEKAHSLMKKRDVNYTLFSEVLYINRPSFKEMEKFIDDVMDNGGRGAVSAPEYDDFRCWMRYKSQTDFFDLYGALRDRRAGADAEGRPLIAVSLDEQEATEANLQRAIEYVYGRKAYGAQSMQMTNDRMLDAMYEAVTAAEGHHGKAITVDDRQIHVDEKPPMHTIDTASASAVQDLFTLLHKQGYLERTGKGPYRIAGRLAAFDPTGMFVGEENAFRATYDAVLGALANFANVKSKLIDGHGEVFRRGLLDLRIDDMIRVAEPIAPIEIAEGARDYREQLRNPHRPLLDPDKLRRHTDRTARMLDALRTHTVDLLSSVLEREGLSLTQHDLTRPTQAAPDFANDRDTPTVVLQWDAGDGGGDKIFITILPAVDATFISKMRTRVASRSSRLREIYIVLVGDVEPVGLDDGAILIGPIGSVERVGAGAGAGAHEMAKVHSTYIMAVASPPDVKTVEAVVSVVKLAVERLDSSNTESFEKFWPTLLRAAGSGDNGHSPRHQLPSSGGSVAGRRSEAADAQGRPARGLQGGASQ